MNEDQRKALRDMTQEAEADGLMDEGTGFVDTRDYPEQIGQLAYDAYWEVVRHPFGKIPWSDVRGEHQQAWIAAAKAVYERVLTDVKHRVEDQLLYESDAFQQGLKDYREGNVVDI